MNLLCLCPTYRKPELAANALACFVTQTYPAASRRLLICDDAMEIYPQRIKEWQVVNRTTRALSMPHKLDEMVGLGNTVFNRQYPRDEYQGNKKVATEIIFEEWLPDAYVVWQEGDIYRPWHLAAVVEALEHAQWTFPENVCTDYLGKLRVQKSDINCHHGALAITKKLLEQLKGWKGVQLENHVLSPDYGRQMLAACLAAGPSCPTDARHRHSYVYRQQHDPIATGCKPLSEEWYTEYPREFEWPVTQVPFLEPKFDLGTRQLLRSALHHPRV